MRSALNAAPLAGGLDGNETLTTSAFSAYAVPLDDSAQNRRLWRPAAGQIQASPDTPLHLSGDEIKSQILRILERQFSSNASTSMSTNTIRQSFPEHVTKLQINSILYDLKDAGRVIFTPGSPPLWSHKPAITSQSHTSASMETECDVGGDPIVLVLNDLGCCHNVLQNLVPYAEQDKLQVKAYADLAYAGFGVRPPVKTRNVQVFHSKTADKNSADVKMIWDLSRYVNQFAESNPLRRLDVYVATKDLQFQSLKALVEENPLHSLTFCTDWEALRMHVEG